MGLSCNLHSEKKRSCSRWNLICYYLLLVLSNYANWTQNVHVTMQNKNDLCTYWTTRVKRAIWPNHKDDFCNLLFYSAFVLEALQVSDVLKILCILNASQLLLLPSQLLYDFFSVLPRGTLILLVTWTGHFGIR